MLVLWPAIYFVLQAQDRPAAKPVIRCWTGDLPVNLQSTIDRGETGKEDWGIGSGDQPLAVGCQLTAASLPSSIGSRQYLGGPCVTGNEIPILP
jgi:hypothetical protein